jgi:NtrC-family two-component system sensor histidine kinase KinB
MTLKQKILIGNGIAFVLIGIVVAWAVTNLVSLGKATEAILRENYRSIIAAENMIDALGSQDSSILLMFLGDVEGGNTQLRKGEAVFYKWLARAKDNITIQGEAELVQRIEAGYDKYHKEFSELTDLPGAKDFSAGHSTGIYKASIYPVFSEVRQACVELLRLNEKTMYAASVRADHVARYAIFSTVFVAASATIIALVFSLLLAERIVRPLRRFMEASRKITSGDYAVQVPVETGDELGRLAGEFNQMAAQLGRYHEMNIEQIISEKNKGEAILSSIDDGLVVFDTGLKVTGINPAARRMLDLEFAETSTLRCADIMTAPHVLELIRKTIETGVQPVIPDEQRIITLQEGERSRHYLFSVTVIRGRDRNLSGIVLLLRDVTRIKEVENLKSEFVTAASHELRTPLTSLGMSIDLILEHASQCLAERERDLLKAAHEEVYRMKALVNDLLDLSKIEAGKIELEFESVSVQTLVDHVKAVFESQMAIKEVTLTSELPKDLPNIRVDANKITWVLTNLISNAMRYVSKGGHIKLAARRIGSNVHLIVRDDGPGIPLEYQTKIFQKFVQVKGQESGGTGLGLAICKEIVRAHGGTIWVESSSGQGSTFTFTLPVSQ